MLWSLDHVQLFYNNIHSADSFQYYRILPLLHRSHSHYPHYFPQSSLLHLQHLLHFHKRHRSLQTRRQHCNSWLCHPLLRDEILCLLLHQSLLSLQTVLSFFHWNKIHHRLHLKYNNIIISNSSLRNKR